MKKLIFSLLFAASYQLGHAQGVHVGLKFGGNFSRFVGPDAPEDTNSRFGIQAGVLAEAGLGTHWAVQPEVLYSSKGTKQISSTGAAVLYQHLGYLDVPLLLKYKTHHVFFEAGPQFAALLGATGTLETSTSTVEEDNKSSFQSFDAGYVAGVGVQDTNGLLLGVRYNGGLANVSSGYQARNSSFQLYLGYVFGGGKP